MATFKHQPASTLGGHGVPFGITRGEDQRTHQGFKRTLPQDREREHTGEDGSTSERPDI